MQFPHQDEAKLSRSGGSAELHPPLNALHHQCSALLNHISATLAGPVAAASSLKSQLDSALESLSSHGKRSFLAAISRFAAAPLSSSSSSSWQSRSPGWARTPRPEPSHRAEAPVARHGFDLAMSTEAMEERLAGIPVYALSNSAEEFVLVSGVNSGKSLGLFCFKREDAEALLEQMRGMNPGMRQGSKVVAVALNKVFQLKVDGVAFRFIPDSCQIMNAIKVKEQVGESVEGFFGVPVFQSRSLVLKSQNKRYRPVFFRKEDLEDSLNRASQQQNYLNPALRKGDIQVSVLEDMIAAMKVYFFIIFFFFK
uniref:Protein TIC 22-like, chloroplastic n=1 Tax=Anthurium amnicola TaxID=1678845 RepID=A0A1D1Y313_9ARAE